MTIDTINKFAFEDEMPDTELSCPERCLFYTLRDIYRQFKAGRFDKARGEAEKNKAIRQYKLDVGELTAARKVVQSSADMWKRIEFANLTYNKDRTLENADAFIEAVYNVPMKEQTRGEIKNGTCNDL